MPALREQDEFWVISTRHLPGVCQQPTMDPQLQFHRSTRRDGWTSSTREEFISGANRAITVFYVPGNRVPSHEAEFRGWLVYGMLKRASDEEPLRVVVWSWPSDRVPGYTRDFREKAARSFDESYYLGHLLAGLDADSRISLIGFSYGARIITGALHLAAGNTMDGMAITSIAASRPQKARVVLMAAATHSYWLLPGELHHGAMSQIDRLLILYNPGDCALKHYHLVEDDGDPRALGYCGFNAAGLGESAERVQQVNVNRPIGNHHDELRFYQHGSIVDRLQRYALWGEIETQ